MFWARRNINSRKGEQVEYDSRMSDDGVCCAIRRLERQRCKPGMGYTEMTADACPAI